MVPRGFVDPYTVTRDGPSSDTVDTDNLSTDSNSKEEGKVDSSHSDFEQRLPPYSSMTTGSRPVTQPTSDADLEASVSILGGHQMVTRPSQSYSSLTAQTTSQVLSNDSQLAGLGMLYSKPEDNLKNSIAPRQKGKGGLLVCPRCAASFSPKQGRDYIDHVDQCCSQP